MFSYINDCIFRIIDGILACMTLNLSWHFLFSTFWFLMCIEFPRYYLTDICVTLKYIYTWKSRKRREAVARFKLFTEHPVVSILVPGKNEGPNIYQLVKSLAEQTYQNFEIVIVDDGSDDDTLFICEDLKRAGLIHKFFRMRERGGKASAANYGAMHCTGKYIVHLDADSSLDRNAIERILLPFYLDPLVKGVGGAVKVRNSEDSICTAMQTLEYMKTIQMGRLGSDMLGIYHIISGAFGAFETRTLREVGYWDIGPGLDGDITQKLRKAGYKVRFAHDAVCMTSVPTKWHALFKQRKRWSKSLVRFRIRKHLDILMPNRNYSFLNALSNFENIMFDCVFNYLWVWYMFKLIWDNTDRLLEIMIVAYLIRLLFAMISFGCQQLISERPDEERHMLVYMLLHTFYSGYFLRITRLIGHTEEFILRTSYKDPWNPSKTSLVAQSEGI